MPDTRRLVTRGASESEAPRDTRRLVLFAGVLTPSRFPCERHFSLFFTCVRVCVCTQGHSRSRCAFCRPWRNRLRRERRDSSLPNPTLCLSVGTPRSEALP
jgi:hypothetical protein